MREALCIHSTRRFSASTAPGGCTCLSLSLSFAASPPFVSARLSLQLLAFDMSSAKRKMAPPSKRTTPDSLASPPKKKRLPFPPPPLPQPPAPSVSPASTPSKGHHDIVKAAFMPLDTAADEKLSKRGKKSKVIPVSNSTGSGKSAVIYVGRIPHGFYEDQMRGFFSQFGDIKRLRLSRNKKTGKSKHYAFIEFESPEVAPIVAEAMHNYLLFESMLQVKVVPVEKLKPSMWIGANKPFRTIEWQKLERERHNRVRTPKEQSRHLGLLVKKDQKRRKKLQDAGIDYDYPELKAIIPPTSKKITFNDNDD